MVHAHPLIHEAKRQAEKLPRYRIKPTTTRAWRIWRMYDEWKPVWEAATEEACLDYLFAKLPAIESEL